jgi:UDP-GlcNAc3NAcA epimerase
MNQKPKILTVVGTRPQFVKAAPVSLALKQAGFEEILVNTNQHYDTRMCDVFFEQLHLLSPAFHLDIGSGSHGYQAGEGMIRLEPILDEVKPALVLVYGDTNATIAGALAAAKLQYPVAHVEAGLRSFNRQMPEEINRVVTDHLSRWHFAPTQTAINNLAAEGIDKEVHLSGDVMLDALLIYLDVARREAAPLLDSLSVHPKEYYLLTLHRAGATADAEQTEILIRAIDRLGKPVLFPVHPRMAGLVEKLAPFRHIRCLEPLSYFEMLLLEESAGMILTDSGGVQKEAAFLEVPCITLREETEWAETVEYGWNHLAGRSVEGLHRALDTPFLKRPSLKEHFGGGEARNRIAAILQQAVQANVN